MTTVTTTSEDLATLEVDALLVGLAQAADGTLVLSPAARLANAATGGAVEAGLRALGATGALGEVHRFPLIGHAPRMLIAAGAGAMGTEGPTRARRQTAIGNAVRAAAGLGRVGVPVFDPELVFEVTEAALLAAYDFRTYRSVTRDRDPLPVREIALVVADPAAVQSDVDRAQAVANGVNLARDLINTPPRDQPPLVLAASARQACEPLGLTVDVTSGDALAAEGFGGLVGVGQGADLANGRGPCLVRIDYRHPDATRHVAVVAKGITFDSGGLSIKGGLSMAAMKLDMGGAAATIGAMQAIGRTKPQVNVTAWLSCAENMPSGTAQRPSDVVTMRNGTTVEVTNTDAEGRLVLGDALVRAGEDQPDLIVDIATLTGACIMAFGPLLMGVMGNDDAERTKLIADAEAAGERAWALPMPDDLRSVLDSPTADLQNSAMSRFGGALVAAHFLKAFIGTRPDGTPIPWVHIDLGGPAWTEAARDGITPRGGTGAGVRTLVSVLHRIAADA